VGQYQEGQRLQGSDGKIYVVQNGVPVLPPASSPFADPRLPAQVTKATNEATASQYMPQTAQSDAQIKVAEAANAVPVANAQRDKAVADARAAEFNAQAAANGGPKLDATQRAKAIQQFNYAKQLQEVVDHLNALALKGPLATSGIEGFKDYLPGRPDNTNFDTAANAARGIVGQTLGFTGGQLNTEREAAKAIGPYLPQSDDFDSTILQKIQALQDMAKNGQANAVQTLGGVPDANGNVHPVGPSQPQASTPQTPDQMNFATGKTRDVVDPVMRATGQKVGAMIAAGAPDAQILGFLQQSGVNPGDTSIQQALQFRKTDDFKKWQRANPGKAYPLGPSFYTKPVPMTDSRALLNKAAAGDMTGAAVAAPVAAANAISGGYLNNLTANPEAAQTGMDLLRGQHPVSSFVGDVAGQATLEGLAGLVPGAQGVMATRYGRRGADAAYGAYSGSGESDGNRGIGAFEGALTNGLFGMAGRGVQRGLGHAATGIQDASLQYLNKAGIPLTIGRIARGVGEIDPHGPTTMGDEIGKGAGGIEERLMGLPGLDAIIGTARQRGDAAFNNVAFGQIAPGVVGRGTEGLARARAAENAAYAKLNGVHIGVDPQFDNALNVASQVAGGLRRHSGDIADVIGDVRAQISNGAMTGEGFQSALQSVRQAKASLSNDVMGHKAATILDGLDAELNTLGARQGGTIAQDLAEANAIHGRRQIVKAAVKSPAAQGAGEMFSPKGLNQASIANTTKFGGSDRALSSDRAFYDLTHAGMGVMPNLTPDSGTAGRLQLYRALGSAGAGLGGGIGALTGQDGPQGAAEGGGIGLGGGLALGTLLSAPYSHAGQKVIQRALLGQRPDAIQKLGEMLLKRNPKYAGMFGSSMGRDYFFQPELSGQ
jgi:hypothetical protein